MKEYEKTILTLSGSNVCASHKRCHLTLYLRCRDESLNICAHLFQIATHVNKQSGASSWQGECQQLWTELCCQPYGTKLNQSYLLYSCHYIFGVPLTVIDVISDVTIAINRNNSRENSLLIGWSKATCCFNINFRGCAMCMT